MSFKTLQDELRQEGYQAALAGKPIDIPETRHWRDSQRAAWEIGWRAGKRELDQQPATGTSIIEALDNALELLEANGYKSGDIHDDLASAIRRLRTMHPQVAKDEIVTAASLAESLRKCTGSTSVTVREEPAQAKPVREWRDAE